MPTTLTTLIVVVCLLLPTAIRAGLAPITWTGDTTGTITDVTGVDPSSTLTVSGTLILSGGVGVSALLPATYINAPALLRVTNSTSWTASVPASVARPLTAGGLLVFNFSGIRDTNSAIIPGLTIIITVAGLDDAATFDQPMDSYNDISCFQSSTDPPTEVPSGGSVFLRTDDTNNSTLKCVLLVRDADAGQAGLSVNETVPASTNLGTLSQLVKARRAQPSAPGTTLYEWVYTITPRAVTPSFVHTDLFQFKSLDGTPRIMNVLISGAKSIATIMGHAAATVWYSQTDRRSNVITATGKLTVVDADDGESMLGEKVTSLGKPLGSLVILDKVAGTWKYTLQASAAADALLGCPLGSTNATDVFKVSSKDNSASAFIRITIISRNTAPVVLCPGRTIVVYTTSTSEPRTVKFSLKAADTGLTPTCGNRLQWQQPVVVNPGGSMTSVGLVKANPTGTEAKFTASLLPSPSAIKIRFAVTDGFNVGAQCDARVWVRKNNVCVYPKQWVGTVCSLVPLCFQHPFVRVGANVPMYSVKPGRTVTLSFTVDGWVKCPLYGLDVTPPKLLKLQSCPKRSYVPPDSLPVTGVVTTGAGKLNCSGNGVFTWKMEVKRDVEVGCYLVRLESSNGAFASPSACQSYLQVKA